MDSNLVQPLLIGILVLAAVYIGLRQVFTSASSSIKRSAIVFAAACGLLTTFWLMENPQALANYSAQIVAAGVAVVLALLVLARRAMR